MIPPIRPIITEPRRVDEVGVRAVPAVTGITALRGFNQPGVVVTIGDGARTLARSGEQPRGNPTDEAGAPADAQGQTEAERVFGSPQPGVEAVFNDEQQHASPPDQERAPRVESEADSAVSAVWSSDESNDDVQQSGVPYAALQRAASVQDLDVDDVAQALAHNQIAVRVLATQDKPDVDDVSGEAEADDVHASDDLTESLRASTVPTDGVPYEALQRAVTEAENAQTDAPEGTKASLTEPVFMPPENGGAPWGREVPFVEETENQLTLERAASGRQDRSPEVQPHA